MAGVHRERRTQRRLGETLLLMDARSYVVVLEPEPDGGYSAHIPAFRGAHTQGETVEEIVSNARDVIAGYVEILTERGEQVPPSDLATSVSITIPTA
jgi:antitoxin HicB